MNLRQSRQVRVILHRGYALPISNKIYSLEHIRAELSGAFNTST